MIRRNKSDNGIFSFFVEHRRPNTYVEHAFREIQERFVPQLPLSYPKLHVSGPSFLRYAMDHDILNSHTVLK